MPEEIESTRIKPGDAYKAGGTFDLTKKLTWTVFEDLETRKVLKSYGWFTPIPSSQWMLEFIEAKSYPLDHIYLAEYNEAYTGENYLGYNGFFSPVAVNQVPKFRKWEPHICRMAHDTDQFNIDATEFRKAESFKDIPMGVHSAETQIRNQNTLQLFRAVIGDAMRRLDRWSKLPPEGDTGAFSTDWKLQEEGIRVIIEDKLCQACEHKYSAREFARLHDYSAWRTILDHRRVLDEGTGSVFMRLPIIVRDTEPWTPHATENLTFFGGTDVDQGWRTAIEWYDEAIHRFDRLYSERYVTT